MLLGYFSTSLYTLHCFSMHCFKEYAPGEYRHLHQSGLGSVVSSALGTSKHRSANKAYHFASSFVRSIYTLVGAR